MSIGKERHERSMMMMGIGIFYIAALAIQLVSGIWLFFASLSDGILAVENAWKAALGMCLCTVVPLGVVNR